MKAPEAAAGAFCFYSGGKPPAPRGANPLEVGGAEAPEAAAHRGEQADREEDPGLGLRIAVARDRTRPLGPLDHVRDVVVHLADVPPKVAPQLGLVACLPERL